jgi:hypothetical protein
MRRLFGIVVSFMLVSLIRAGVAFTPHPSYAAPGYFSGSNARAFYSAHVTYPDVHISAAELWLNGEELIHQDYAVGGTSPHYLYVNEAHLAVMFDSNHFTNDSSLTVKMRIQAGGVWYEDSYSANVLNFARAFGRHEWEADPDSRGAYYADQKLSSIGYTSSYIPDEGWNPTVVNTEQNADSNILYFNSHGLVGELQTDSNDLIYANDSLGSPDFGTWRETTIGSGLPPFNSTAKPAINLCDFQTCLSGSDDSFGTLLFPYYNGYGKLLESQAVCGYSVLVYVSDASLLTNLLWGKLAEAETLGSASFSTLVRARDVYQVHVLDGETDRLIATDDFHVYGDDTARIKDVYTNDDTIPDTWWRQIYDV